MVRLRLGETGFVELIRALDASFAREAALRDREGILPLKELDAFSQSGL